MSDNPEPVPTPRVEAAAHVPFTNAELVVQVLALRRELAEEKKENAHWRKHSHLRSAANHRQIRVIQKMRADLAAERALADRLAAHIAEDLEGWKSICETFNEKSESSHEVRRCEAVLAAHAEARKGLPSP